MTLQKSESESYFYHCNEKWHYKRLLDERFFIFRLNTQNAADDFWIDSDI